MWGKRSLSKKKNNFSLFIGLLLFFLYSCSPKPFYKEKNLRSSLELTQNANPKYTFYLVGDAGKSTDSSLVFKVLKNLLSKEKNDQHTTVFLGDNIYFYGLPEENAKDYPEAKKRLDAQIQAVKSSKGNTIFIPGNHDWALDGKDGWNAIKRQQKYIENTLGENSFFPKNGCPGPELVHVTNEFAFIIYDSQWWIHPHEKPDSTLCKTASQSKFLDEMKKLIEENKDKIVIINGHHPFYSCSSHGGRFTIKEHLFPLRFLNAHLYIPLPIIGSGLILARYLAKHPSDSWNPRYKQLKNQLLPIFETHPHLIYVSGHDHNLQYRKQNSVHHIISGSGSKISEVGKSKKWEFTYSNYGFAIIKVFDNKKTDLEFWSVDKKNPNGKLVYKKNIIP
jgi:hypothetical protein